MGRSGTRLDRRARMAEIGDAEQYERQEMEPA
jgi:hypothetical protein